MATLAEVLRADPGEKVNFILRPPITRRNQPSQDQGGDVGPAEGQQVQSLPQKKQAWMTSEVLSRSHRLYLMFSVVRM